MSELEERWRDVGEFIREQRRMGELSLRRLSELAGVSNPYLSQIERGLRKPSAEILRQIAQALQISAETLYVRAGILDDRIEGADPVGEIRRDPALGEDQKRTLIHIYESFRAEFAARQLLAAGTDTRALIETLVAAAADGSGDVDQIDQIDEIDEIDDELHGGTAEPVPPADAEPAAVDRTDDDPADDDPTDNDDRVAAGPVAEPGLLPGA